MKRRNSKYFTLIELMFVIAILVVLIAISWVAGTKVLRGQTEAKTKAEITLLMSAIEQYKVRFGHYFQQSSNTSLNFAEYLSKVLPTQSGWTGSKRPMFIDFKSSDILTDPTDGYDDASGAASTTVNDPYENAYIYLASTSVDANGNPLSYLIYSKGLDAAHGAGDSSSKYSDKEAYEANADHADNEDNVVSTEL